MVGEQPNKRKPSDARPRVPASAPGHKAADEQMTEQPTVEDFEERGMGVAAKE